MTNSESNKTMKPEVDLIDIYHALDNIVPPGHAWTSGESNKLPVVPGLCVNGIGDIPLPMTSFTAKELQRVSGQGEGVEATSVRKTIQIRGDQVTLKNPAWKAALDELTWKIAKILGVNQSLVVPKLHKLLVYEEGSVLEKHEMIKEEKGTFGKLTIQLPSVFSGATYVLSNKTATNYWKEPYRHEGARLWTRSMDMPEAPYQCNYIAHYADCKHEIPALQSGHLTVLEYSLCYLGRKRAKPNLDSSSRGHIVSLFNRLPKSKTFFVVPLDKSETPCGHEVSRLTGPNKKFTNAFSNSVGWEIAFARLMKSKDVHNGEPYLAGWRPQGGKYASSTKTWMYEQHNFSTVHDGGMVLSSKESFDKKWQEMEETAASNSTENQVTFVMFVFKPRDSFERLCNTQFGTAVQLIENSPERLSMAIDHLRRESNTFLKHDTFSALRKVVKAIHGESGDYWVLLDFLFQRLTSKAVPPEDVRAFVGTVLKQHGNSDKTKGIHSYLKRLSINNENQSPELSSSKAKFFQALYDETGWFDVAKEQELEKKFLMATKGGRPVFSWSMPDAKTTSPALDSFLHGEEEGPKEIIVGGGIDNARQLCAVQEDETLDYLVVGYSAEITNTGKFGAKASLMVHKTKQLYQAQVDRYEENIKMLRDVQTKLHKHRQPKEPDQQTAQKRVRLQDIGNFVDVCSRD